MKIAYIVLKSMPFGGGVEKYTEEVGSRLSLKGHEVIVYAMKHYGAKEGSYRGMSIKIVPTIKTKNLEKIIASINATVMQCMEKNIDIVHYHAFGPAMFCFVPRLIGRKTIVQGHGLEWKRSRWGAIGRLFLMLSEMPSVRFPHTLSIVSKVQQKYIREKYGRKSVYIPTGVNKPTRENPALIKQYGLMGNDYILFAARLVREKGAHYLIKAYNQINANIKLVIAGDALHEETYKSELHELCNGNKNIIFTGFAHGKLLQELFSNCRFFVLPSEIEGLPTVLLEAMSYGNCCLVSDIPENIEAMQTYGYTFRNRDIADLAGKLEFLILNQAAIDVVKEPAKDHVIRNYSWDKIAADFEVLYKCLLRK